MTFTGANDADGAGGRSPCSIDMSVLDLAIFLRVHRAGRGQSAGEVSATVSRWFGCEIDPREVECAFPRMLERGWLVRRESGVRATTIGRKHGQLHLRGIIRMIDQGTKMVDVALTMSMLRLAETELDGEHEEPEEDDDGED